MNLVEGYLDVIQEEYTTEIIVAAIMAAIVAYRRYLSAAAQKCKNTKGQAKTICIIQNQIVALKKSLKDFSKASSSCKDDNCKKSIESKVEKITNKIKQLETKLNTAKKGMSKSVWKRDIVMA